MRASRLSSLVVALLAATFVGACASGGSGVLSSTNLTADQLAGLEYPTVYDFLRSHARARFVARGGQEYLTVYGGGVMRSNRNTGAILVVNGQEVRGEVAQVLRQMSLDRVASLQILRATEAGTRYGGDGRAGAVVIRTKEQEDG